jgi:hypothetical protein
MITSPGITSGYTHTHTHEKERERRQHVHQFEGKEEVKVKYLLVALAREDNLLLVPHALVDEDLEHLLLLHHLVAAALLAAVLLLDHLTLSSALRAHALQLLHHPGTQLAQRHLHAAALAPVARLHRVGVLSSLSAHRSTPTRQVVLCVCVSMQRGTYPAQTVQMTFLRRASLVALPL